MTRYTVEARELHPVTGEPLGEWFLLKEFDDRSNAVRSAVGIEKMSTYRSIYRARIRPYVAPYCVETP